MADAAGGASVGPGSAERDDEPGDDDRAETTDLRRREHVLRATTGAEPGHVHQRQDDDDRGGERGA